MYMYTGCWRWQQEQGHEEHRTRGRKGTQGVQRQGRGHPRGAEARVRAPEGGRGEGEGIRGGRRRGRGHPRGPRARARARGHPKVMPRASEAVARAPRATARAPEGDDEGRGHPNAMARAPRAMARAPEGDDEGTRVRCREHPRRWREPPRAPEGEGTEGEDEGEHNRTTATAQR
jgi:hypothetical protein